MTNAPCTLKLVGGFARDLFLRKWIAGPRGLSSTSSALPGQIDWTGTSQDLICRYVACSAHSLKAAGVVPRAGWPLDLYGTSHPHSPITCRRSCSIRLNALKARKALKSDFTCPMRCTAWLTCILRRRRPDKPLASRRSSYKRFFGSIRSSIDCTSGISSCWSPPGLPDA